jgi:peptide/nickel transport system permease protein
MGRFLLKRVGLALITLVLISIAVFAVGQVLPGDVGRTILGPFATNAQVANLDHQMGWIGPCRFATGTGFPAFPG